MKTRRRGAVAIVPASDHVARLDAAAAALRELLAPEPLPPEAMPLRDVNILAFPSLRRRRKAAMA